MVAQRNKYVLSHVHVFYFLEGQTEMKAVTNVSVFFPVIMLHCFLYCAQVLWEKRCFYNKSCSYGNQDDVSAGRCSCWFSSDSSEFNSICLCDHLPVVGTQSEGEANANINLDLFVGFCDRGMKVDPLTFHSHAHTLFH